MIGEMASVCSAYNTAQSMFINFYTSNYDGAWSWMMLDNDPDYDECSDGREISLNGMAAISGRTDHGQIAIKL